MAKKNDDVILQLKKQVNDKKKSIAKAQKFEPVTNLSLELFGQRYNLNVVDKNQLLLLKGTLSAIQSNVETAIVIGGFTIFDWCIDLENKYNLLNVREEQERLKVLESKLHNLLSVDKKVELELATLASQI